VLAKVKPVLNRNRVDNTRLNLVKILYENSDIKLTVTERWRVACLEFDCLTIRCDQG